MHIESRSEALVARTLPAEGVQRKDDPRDIRISCVVPCLNECDNLRVLLPALMSMLSKLCTAWEVIVTDDGSTDGTADLMQKWSAIDGFRYLRLSRNFGKEAALSAGLEASTGDVVISLDADMQHPPALIPEMLARWRAGADMVYAVRENRDSESWFKRAGSRLFYRMLSDGRGVDVPANAGDFRLMDRRVVQALNALPERTRFMKGLYAWVGFQAEALPYVPDARAHGNTHYSKRKLFKLAFAGLTAFTTWPLRLVSMMGLAFSLVSFAYGCYLVVDYLMYGNAVSGWTTIVAALMFFAGINLLSLGVVGEYVGRIFDEVKGRPLYVVREQRGKVFTEKK
ncbi:glycosyltransferase family 2 protein [Bordetella bronchialis]|uniref:Glycosyl transferase family 2 n=1 Tax=Bordetella bronchialis TaxID=463025 RepID=A0A193FLH4_9BORD|nr:glycosyltransferase family 2 protein [Bordetella bronchialis]ANN68612.1 glycosyl transferase family 2 [Bordetella bronchialis]ANN73751.1 glycosyl transferase family 2 [Bordetella bronchialis]